MLNSVFLNKTDDLAAELHARLITCIECAEPQPRLQREAALASLDRAFAEIDGLIARLGQLTDRRETP